MSRGIAAGAGPARPWVAPAAGVGGVFTLVLAAAMLFQFLYTDRIMAGVRVLGLDLGGQSPDSGRALLQASASQLSQQLVTLRAGGREWQLTASELGMRVDADQMVQEAYDIGRVGNPLQRVASQWGALLFGARFSSPLLQFDPDRQQAVLQRIAGEIDRAPVDARIDVQVGQSGGVTVATVPEIAGARLQIPESGQRMREAINRGLTAVVDLVVAADQPALTRSGIESARSRAERMVQGPTTLTLNNNNWSIPSADIARTLDFEPSGRGELRVVVNPERLEPLVGMIDRQIGQLPSNARFEWNGGNLRLLRDSQDGRGVDVASLAHTLEERLPAGDRSFAVPISTTHAKVTADSGPRLGIRELIKEGRTSFAGAGAEKQFNVGLATSRLNGTVVPPGEIFSFNREVGPTTLEAGFKTGWGITVSAEGAKTIPSVAGGICQVATTLFQPVFHAGYAIEERHSHLYWIQSYGQPPLGMRGLDATVDEAFGLDFQFINNTEHYMLIQSRIEGSTIVFGLYGTRPTWDVKVEGPTITNVVPTDPTPRRQLDPTMPTGRSIQVETAQDGFVAVVTRTVTDGNDVRRLALRSQYVPAHNVILHGPEPPKPPEEEDAASQPAPSPSTNQAPANPPSGQPAAGSPPVASGGASAPPATAVPSTPATTPGVATATPAATPAPRTPTPGATLSPTRPAV